MTPRKGQRDRRSAERAVQRKLCAVTVDLYIAGEEIDAFCRLRRESPNGFPLQHALPMRPIVVVGVDDRHAVSRQAGKNFALRLGNTGQRTKAFQVSGRQVIYQGGLRTS
ncbi:hypothetical protein D3C72_1514780 [compost metagenome]